MQVRVFDIKKDRNFGLYIYKSTPNQVSKISLIKNINNNSNISEILTFIADVEGWYYIQINWIIMTNSTYTTGTYKLYTNLYKNQAITQSLYVYSPENQNYLSTGKSYSYILGRDATDKCDIIVLLYNKFACKNGVYGAYTYSGQFIPMHKTQNNPVSIEKSIEDFIIGFNDNPSRSSIMNATIAVGFVSKQTSTSYPLTNAQYTLHAMEFKTMLSRVRSNLNSINKTNASYGRITNIYASYDAEIDWNYASKTLDWKNGFCNSGIAIPLFVLADLNGTDADNSGLSDYLCGYSSLYGYWYASDMYNLTMTNGAYPFPQIGNVISTRRWCNFVKWAEFNKPYFSDFKGICNTNRWGSNLLRTSYAYELFEAEYLETFAYRLQNPYMPLYLSISSIYMIYSEKAQPM